MPPTMTTTQLSVSGMTCGACVRHVEGALRAIPGVAKVEVNLAEQRAVIEHDGTASNAVLCDAVADAGYDATATS